MMVSNIYLNIYEKSEVSNQVHYSAFTTILKGLMLVMETAVIVNLRSSLWQGMQL